MTRLTTALFLGLFLSSTPAFGFLQGVDYLQFDGWDHNLIADVGQTFTDLYEDVDVTVTLEGEFDIPTRYAPGIGWINIGGHRVPGTHALRFSFSEPVPVVVRADTVDMNEHFIVSADGEKEYFVIRGAMPTVANPGPIANSILLRGKGFGLDPMTGASSGQILIHGETTDVRVEHEALANEKYERIMIGVVAVPEPQTFVLAALACLLVCCRRR